MRVKFNPTKDEQECGIVSWLYWSNPALEKAMKEAFSIRDWEQIKFIEVLPDGIKAIFEIVPNK